MSKTRSKSRSRVGHDCKTEDVGGLLANKRRGYTPFVVGTGSFGLFDAFLDWQGVGGIITSLWGVSFSLDARRYIYSYIILYVILNA